LPDEPPGRPKGEFRSAQHEGTPASEKGEAMPAPMSEGRITRVVGALAEASGMRDARLNELVRVGAARLQAEVLRIAGDSATLQVFEDTGGLALGEPVHRSGGPLLAELGPGLLGTVFDGIGRPLARLAAASGDFMTSGVELPTLDRACRHEFQPAAAVGAELAPGDLLGQVDERGLVHRVLVPPGRSGRLRAIRAGAWRVDEAFAEFDDGSALTLLQRWPVRRPRPAAARLPYDRPFITGQRIFDLLFPVAEGGVVAVPGGFGTGKTVIEQSLAKYADADVVVYVGCGERGNEMAEVLADFAKLVDPRRGTPALDRTVLVVNTSNMPVAAREASIYFGLTIAEYYRDMGYRVAVMADSLSRWAEALREIGSRLQQMPGEEGYPTYLASRAASLHERAGRVRCAGQPERHGAVTLIGAVSPPGGDFSEPVTQACMRVAGALWALDAELAHQRQFPAVDWHASYSLYAAAVQGWFAQAADARWPALRAQVLALLQRDAELRDVAAIVGPEALADADRVTLAGAALVRELVLGQSAFDPQDAFCPPAKTFALAQATLEIVARTRLAIARGKAFSEIDLMPVQGAIAALRGAPSADHARCAEDIARALDHIAMATS
jgi:V/A-type H+-transporting ATPase subunit A